MANSKFQCIKNTCTLHVAGVALHNSGRDSMVADGKIIGCGIQSIISKVDSERYGDGGEVPWPTSATAAQNAAKMLVIVNDKILNVLKALGELQWDQKRPDQAMYGMSGTITAQQSLTLKARNMWIAKAESHPKRNECTLENAGVLLLGSSKVSPGFYFCPVMQPMTAPQARGYVHLLVCLLCFLDSSFNLLIK
jgi:hypothetical protein